MAVEVTERQGARVVTPTGVIDLDTSPALRAALLDAVRGPAPVVVDLSRLERIDSSGVASLLEAHTAARRAAVPFTLAGVGPATLRMLALARLDRIFVLRDDVDAALAVEG